MSPNGKIPGLFKVPDAPPARSRTGSEASSKLSRTNTLQSSSGYITDTASTTSSKREARELAGYDSTLLSGDDETDEGERTDGGGATAPAVRTSPSAPKRRREYRHRPLPVDDDDDEDGIDTETERLNLARLTPGPMQDDTDRPDDTFPLPVIGNDPSAVEFLFRVFNHARADIEKSSHCSMKLDEYRHQIKLWGNAAQVADAKNSLNGVAQSVLTEIEHKAKHAIEVPHERIGRAPTMYQIKLAERREKRLAEKKKWLSTEESDFLKMPFIGCCEWPGDVNLKTHYGSDLRLLHPICMDCEVYLRYEGSAEGGPIFVYGEKKSNIEKALKRLEFCYLRILNKTNLETFAKSNVKHLLKIFSNDHKPFLLCQISPEDVRGTPVLKGCPQPTVMKCFRANAALRAEALHPPLRENGPLDIVISRPTNEDKNAVRLSHKADPDEEDVEMFQEGLNEIILENLQHVQKTLLTGLGFVHMLHGRVTLKFTIGAGVLRSWPMKGFDANVQRVNTQLRNSRMASEIREAIDIQDEKAFAIIADLESTKRRSGETTHKTLMEINAAKSSIFQPTSRDRQAKRRLGYSSVILEAKFNEDGTMATWGAWEDHQRVAEVNVLAIDETPALSWSAAVDFAKLAPTKPTECVYETLVKSMTSPRAGRDLQSTGFNTAREVRFRNPNGGEIRIGAVERQQIHSFWWNDQSDLVLDVIYHEIYDCSDLALGKVSGFEVRLLPTPKGGVVQKRDDNTRPKRHYWSFEARSPELAAKLAQNNDLGLSKAGITPTWRATSQDIFGREGVGSVVLDMEEMTAYLGSKGVCLFEAAKQKKANGVV